MASDTRECPFCAETIKAKANKCRYCGEFLDGYTRESVLGDRARRDKVGSDKVEGDKIEVGGMDDVADAAIGRQTQAVQASDVEGPVIQAWRDVTMSKSQRDEQYDIVMNWDGKTRMRDFDLAGRNLSDLRLGNADLREANLREADLSRADLTKTDLVRANLSRADLHGADLHGADLRAAFLIKSDLREADLHGANLSRASLSGANLSGANLSGADLHWTILHDANLRDADLRGTDLRGAGVTNDQLALAMSLVGATMPDGTKHS